MFGTDPVSDGLSEPRDSLRRLAELVGYFLGWLVMMIDADRFWQNEPLAIALVPSRRNQVPEALSRFGESYCKLSMSGLSGEFLAIRYKKRPARHPCQKAARGVSALTRRAMPIV